MLVTSVEGNVILTYKLGDLNPFFKTRFSKVNNSLTNVYINILTKLIDPRCFFSSKEPITIGAFLLPLISFFFLNDFFRLFDLPYDRVP